MDKVKGTVKEVVSGLPMAVLMLVATVGVIKLLAWGIDKAKPGFGAKIRNAADVNA